MKRWIKTSGVLFLSVLLAFAGADTFKHNESGEVFTGFVTQKVTGEKTLVYNADESKMTPVVLRDYTVTPGSKGRRKMVSLLLLNQPEVLLSDTVARKAAAMIMSTSNKGPQAIILQIDGPGGSGSAMKTIAEAVSQTKNCPTIAYISEGAYSAAAVVAMACDKIYIKSTASIGAVGSNRAESAADLSYAEFLSIYSSDSLLDYSGYAATMAQQHNRPELLARALIDKRISIIEVANINGSRALVARDDRQATQTLIRTVCEGVSADLPDRVSPADIVGKVLNLTAKDAVELGIADGIAESTAEILSGMHLAEVKIAPVPGVEKTIKKYNAARRNISEKLYRIEQYERDIEILSNQFTTIDNQLRTGTQTRETRHGDPGYRSSRRRDRYDASYDDYDSRDINGNRQQGNTRRDTLPRSQTIITEEPRINIEMVHGQLTAALRDVVGEYRRVLNLVDRWPSGLPPKVTRTMLQEDMKSADSELDRLYRYQPIYPSQEQPRYPLRNSRDRRRY